MTSTNRVYPAAPARPVLSRPAAPSLAPGSGMSSTPISDSSTSTSPTPSSTSTPSSSSLLAPYLVDGPIFQSVWSECGGDLDRCVRRFHQVYKGKNKYTNDMVKLQFTALEVKPSTTTTAAHDKGTLADLTAIHHNNNQNNNKRQRSSATLAPPPSGASRVDGDHHHEEEEKVQEAAAAIKKVRVFHQVSDDDTSDDSGDDDSDSDGDQRRSAEVYKPPSLQASSSSSYSPSPSSSSSPSSSPLSTSANMPVTRSGGGSGLGSSSTVVRRSSAQSGSVGVVEVERASVAGLLESKYDVGVQHEGERAPLPPHPRPAVAHGGVGVGGVNGLVHVDRGAVERVGVACGDVDSDGELDSLLMRLRARKLHLRMRRQQRQQQAQEERRRRWRERCGSVITGLGRSLYRSAATVACVYGVAQAVTTAYPDQAGQAMSILQQHVDHIVSTIQ